jgi:hypothetical protein
MRAVVLDKSFQALHPRDLGGAASWPLGVAHTPSVERVVYHNLAAREEFHVWSADAGISALFMVNEIADRENVESLRQLAHSLTGRVTSILDENNTRVLWVNHRGLWRRKA